MPSEKPGWTVISAGIARMILRDRGQRRKLLARMLMVALGLMATGLWVIDEWIWGSPWRVLFWWGGCAVITCVVILFALYDALAVIREEREKISRKSRFHEPRVGTASAPRLDSPDDD